MKLLDQAREADNEFEEGKSVRRSLHASCYYALETSSFLFSLLIQGNKNKENHGETNGTSAEPMDTSAST